MVTTRQPLLSIVVPVFHNRETLEPLTDRVHKALDAAGIREHELVFVNDSCPDNSFTVLERLALHDPRVTVVDLLHNVGQHRAVLTGLRFARGVWICVMDGDLQDPPEAVPALLAQARAQAATVFATRRGIYQSWGRMLSSKLFKACLAWAAGVPHGAGMFFIIPEEIKNRLQELPVSAPFIPAMLGFASRKIQGVPVYRNSRLAGHSSYSAAARLRTALRALKCTLQCRLGDPGAGRAGSAPAAVRVIICSGEIVKQNEFSDFELRTNN